MNKIKISLLIVVTALCCAFQAKADFKYGIKAGLNVDKMHTNSKLLDSDNRCGFTAGVTAEFTVPIIGVGADVSVMFTRMYTELNTFGYTNKIHGSFLEIPLHLKYKVNIPAVNHIIRPYVFTGPSLATKLGSSRSFGDTKTAQWGWDLGLGIELVQHLQVGAGYTWGMNKIASIWTSTSDEIKVRNNYWTVTAAWLF